MTNASRRTVLLGPAASATAASASVQAGTSSEDPELVRLGNELPEVSQAFLDAKANQSAIFQEYSPQWPAAPESIMGNGGPDIERNLDGWGIERQLAHEKKPQSHFILTPSEISVRLSKHEHQLALKSTTKSDRDWHSEQIQKLSRAMPDAQAYHAETTRIQEESGYISAKGHKRNTCDQLSAHIKAIMQSEPQTMEGVVIQAQALVEWENVGKFWRATEEAALEWPGALSRSIMRMAAV